MAEFVKGKMRKSSFQSDGNYLGCWWVLPAVAMAVEIYNLCAI